MEALHDLVKLGKVRYIGASSMWTHQLAILQHTAERRGWTKFISMQNHYNLLYREEEREMLKYCKLTGVGVVPVSHGPRISLQKCWLLSCISGRLWPLASLHVSLRRTDRRYALLLPRTDHSTVSALRIWTILLDGFKRLLVAGIGQ